MGCCSPRLGRWQLLALMDHSQRHAVAPLPVVALQLIGEQCARWQRIGAAEHDGRDRACTQSQLELQMALLDETLRAHLEVVGKQRLTARSKHAGSASVRTAVSSASVNAARWTARSVSPAAMA